MQKLKANFESEVPEDTNYFIKKKVENMKVKIYARASYTYYFT